MIVSVHFNADSLLYPFLQMGISWINSAGHDTDARVPIDFFESLQNRPQIGFVFLYIPHVINGEYTDRFDRGISIPLGCRQPGKFPRNVIGIILIQVNQPVTGFDGFLCCPQRVRHK